MKFLKSVLIIFLILIVIFLGIVLIEFQGPGESPHKERFVVSLNVKEEEIISQLVEKKFLRNREIFEIAIFLVCWREKKCPVIGQWIEPGAYLVAKNMNAYQLAKTLITGPYQRWVTIPPGKRKEQTALILKKALNWTEEKVFDFIKTAKEGYLYPETYLINPNDTSDQVADKLLATFNENFSDQIYQEMLAVNIKNDTAIKIASLIERESGSNADKPIIAQIILNRLEKGMKLEIDATVQYALASKECQFSGLNQDGQTPITECNFWPKVSGQQLRTTPSAYNTYLHYGLPPEPICSPSLASIRAVANPEKTDALFYLHSPDKKIHTAKTYQEHQENIENFLR